MRKASLKIFLVLILLGAVGFVQCTPASMEPVDYVDPSIGGISHLLVPTFPTTQLPSSMLRVFPDRRDYTDEYVMGLPVAITNHRERSSFKLLPLPDRELSLPMKYNYDHEHITPYCFEVELADNSIRAEYALSHQSAVYQIEFRRADMPSVALYTEEGALECNDGALSGYYQLPNDTRLYVYMESQTQPESISAFSDSGKCYVLNFPPSCKSVKLRYGISLISAAQAKENLYREIRDYDLDKVRKEGRKQWNKVLGRIRVKGDERQKKIFYSSYYRTFERPLCITEGNRYFSAYDHKVHEDEAPFYVDDWLWDTYRAAHPLRSITDAATEEDILSSFLRMARQKGDMWMPTFPEVNGDSRRMNSNHGVPVVAEAMALGLDADYAGLYEVCSRGIDEKTLAPWSAAPAGWIDDFYKEHGYIPALAPGELETDPNVHHFEKRQPVAVTLGTSYDQWCLYSIAKGLGLEQEETNLRAAHALDYRNIYNPETGFFHPKDKDGRFIEGLNYGFCGGLGAREYYGENNGWVYRWDVQHNIADLIRLMGGRERFCEELDRTFGTPLGKSKFSFYAMLPDHTGNVGQFSMANEPSLHVPYLYNYAGKPWKTQKRIRQMLETWFRDDLMGIPGDEDGGGMTSFVVFSMMGFYPVTPGTASYNIGSPVFEDVKLTLSNGNVLHIVAEGVSRENKYIQSATLNGRDWNKAWFRYEDIKDGATLKLKMGSQPDMEWGSALENAPVSADIK